MPDVVGREPLEPVPVEKDRGFMETGKRLFACPIVLSGLRGAVLSLVALTELFWLTRSSRRQIHSKPRRSRFASDVQLAS